MNLIKKIVLSLVAVIVIAVIIFIVWANLTYKAEPNKLALAMDEKSNEVQISEKSDYWEIIPKSSAKTSDKYQDAGLIFYPGAKVEPQAYFYKLSDLSNGQAGNIKVFITKPTLNLAFFSINQADQVIKDHPEVKKWIIGGHSLGGAMSCEYVKSNTQKISELWLFAAYCNSDISNLDIKVISIHGSLDGVLNTKNLTENRKFLSAATSDFEIQGMNHAQFGNYGFQSGDNEFSKSDEDVRKEIDGILSNLFSK